MDTSASELKVSELVDVLPQCPHAGPTCLRSLGPSASWPREGFVKKYEKVDQSKRQD